MFAKDGNRAFPSFWVATSPASLKKSEARSPSLKQAILCLRNISLDDSGGYAQYALVTEREPALKPKSLSLCGGGSSADCRVDSVAGVDRHRQTERGPDGAHSWRLGRL